MHRRHVASVVALAVLALSAGCVGALGQSDSPEAAETNHTIEVTATGEVTAEPDQAVVRASVIARGDTAEVARERLAENVSALREGLADADVGEDRIETAGYALDEERPDRAPEEEPDGTTYVARQSFEITVDETDRAGDVIDAAVGSGATQVEGVQFTLSDDARADVKQDALTAAMEDARRNADTLAAAEDLSVGSALQVTNTDVRPVPYEAEVAMASGDASGETTIDGGPVTVSASVEVVYEAN